MTDEEAHSYARTPEQIIPRQASNARTRGRDLFTRGEPAKAAIHLRRWLKHNPHDAGAHHDLAASLFANGQHEEAEAAAARAVSLNPDFIQAWVSLSTIQAARGQRGYPLRSLLQATKRNPGDLELRSRLGVMLLDHSFLDQAVRAFRLVLREKPDHIDAISGLAMTLERQGNLQEAYELLAPMIHAEQTHPRMGATWGAVCRGLKRPEEGLPPLERMLSNSKLKNASRILVLYEIGQLYDKLNQPDEAWGAISQANSLQPVQFKPDELVDRTDRIIATFSKEALARLPKANDMTRLPVLIFGAPRSGTSLVEQILASHSKVFGAGELGDIQGIESVIEQATGDKFPEGVLKLDAATTASIGDWYIQNRRDQAPDAMRVTDKMPQNFEYLGLVSQILPGATLIHCVRDPRDVAISCFFQNFKAPLAWSYKIPWIEMFLEQHQRLMDHWESVLPLPIHRCSYEELVDNPEPHIRALVKVCGLEWEPDCLDFHQTKRIVATASYAQATQPIYRSSLGRAERYGDFLDGIGEHR